MVNLRFSRPALKGLAFVFVVALSFGLPKAAAAGLEDKAGEFIRSLSEEAINALTLPDTPDKVRIDSPCALSGVSSSAATGAPPARPNNRNTWACSRT